MKKLTLYLRYEPTVDAVLLDHVKRGLVKLGKQHRDVAVYSDAACTELKARWPWHYSDKPTRRNKAVTLNCYRWRAVWVDDLKPSTGDAK